MSTLNEYLVQKRTIVRAFRSAALADPKPVVLSAHARAAGRSGIREIHIRNFQVISDSPPFLAGYDLGPGSPELMLGSLGSCLVHMTLTLAAELEVSLNTVEAEVTGQIHPLAQTQGYEHIPVWPHNIGYKLSISSDESAERVAALYTEVERICPIYNLLKHPQEITGELIHIRPSGVQEA